MKQILIQLSYPHPRQPTVRIFDPKFCLVNEIITKLPWVVSQRLIPAARTIFIADAHRDDGGTARAFALARFAFSIQAATSSASFVRRRESQAFGAAILPLPAGTLTQLEKFQKRLNVLGKTLGHTPSLRVFCWLEVTDFDRFFGSLFLVLHVCYLSFAIR